MSDRNSSDAELEDDDGDEMFQADSLTSLLRHTVKSKKVRTRRGDEPDGGCPIPVKGWKSEEYVRVEELQDADHLFVEKYFLRNKSKAEENRITSECKKKGKLWAHHLLIGKIYTQNPAGATEKTRRFMVYEFTASSGSSSERKADTMSYLVIATPTTSSNTTAEDTPRHWTQNWTFTQSNNKENFQKYYTRGLRRYNHSEYENTDPAEVIRRAKEATRKCFKCKYRKFKRNCEHFVTACKGLCDGYGVSFQFDTRGKSRWFEVRRPEERRPGDAAEAEKASVAPETVYDDDDSDKDAESYHGSDDEIDRVI